MKLPEKVLEKIDNSYNWTPPACVAQIATDRAEIVEIMMVRREQGMSLFNLGDSWNDRPLDYFGVTADESGNGVTSRTGKGASPGSREVIFEGAMGKAGRSSDKRTDRKQSA